MGFLRRSDEQSWSNWAALQFQRPAWFYQRANWNFNWWQRWTTGGLATERAANSNAHVYLNNRWWVHAGGTLSRIGSTFCDRCARGGPAVRESPALSLWAGLEGDSRPIIVPELWLDYTRGDEGRSEYFDVNPELTLRLSSRLSSSAGLFFAWNRDDLQWYGNFSGVAGVTHYTFAHLEQRTASITWRADYTFSPDLSLQIYAQPFVSRGTFSDVRELAAPSAADYDSRYRPYEDAAITADPGGFNVKQFRSNVVLRWEYSPGSTLFVVWNQGRDSFVGAPGVRSLSRNMGDLFDLHPENTFLVKASYWLNW
jgi:hypothetical protein